MAKKKAKKKASVVSGKFDEGKKSQLFDRGPTSTGFDGTRLRKNKATS